MAFMGDDMSSQHGLCSMLRGMCVMSSLCDPSFKLMGDVQNRGVVFTFSHDRPLLYLYVWLRSTLDT